MRYSRMLEESDFRHKTADFLWLYIVCGAMLLVGDGARDELAAVSNLLRQSLHPYTH